MNDLATTDTAVPSSVEATIAALYARASRTGDPGFRTWALEQLREAIGFDAAIWRRLTAANHRVFAVSTLKLPASFSAAWDRNADHDSMATRMRQSVDTVHTLSAEEDSEWRNSSEFHSVYAPLGICHALGIETASHDGAPINQIMLFRKKHEPAFSPVDCSAFARIVFHVIRAATAAQFVALGEPNARFWNCLSAVADNSGRLYEVQEGFLTLISRHFPDWAPGQPLPFHVHHAYRGKTQTVGSLSLYTEAWNDLTLIRAWESSPMEQLSAQERSIVEAVRQGKTYKAIAQDMGLAPSTVSTHVYSACAKLQVRGKNGLIDALGPAEPATDA